MAAGSVVSFGCKTRVPQFASHNSLARSSGKYRTYFLSSLKVPGSHRRLPIGQFSFVFIFHTLALESGLLGRVTTPQAGRLCPFLRPPPAPSCPTSSATHR